MKQKKNKGRKIYKTKEKNYYGKSFGGKFVSACLTILLLGGIGFLGYSVAEPMLDFTRKQGDTNIEEPTETTAENDVEETTEQPEKVLPDFEPYKSVALSDTDMINVETLNSALRRIPESADIEYVQLPLKITGGSICYNTSSYDAVSAGAIVSKIELDEAIKAVKEAGYKPTALISTFDDSILPTYLPETGYKNAENGTLWLDNTNELIGKPCTTPFSDTAVSYNGYLVRESSMAGFEVIVCSDFRFPYFTSKELSTMTQRLSNEHDRISIFADVSNSYAEKAKFSNADFFIEISAADILKGNADILNSDNLETETIIVNINTDEIKKGVDTGKTVYEFSGTPTDMTQKMLGFISEQLSGFNVIIRISGDSFDFSELLKTTEEIAELGYNSFVIG